MPRRPACALVRVRPVSLLNVLIVAVFVAGCFNATPALKTRPLDGKDTVVKAPAHLASYIHDVSNADLSLTPFNQIVQQFRVPVLEGIHLDVWIARPKTAEKVPLVLEMTPYYGGGSPTQDACSVLGTVLDPAAKHSCFYPWGEKLLTYGYAVGIASVRGTGNSEGCFSQAGPREAKDTAAVIQFLAGQDWSNGKVGMMGVSYPGTTPQDAWVEAPPALKTIVPISGISDMYKYNFVNGIPLNIQGFGFNTYYWAIVGAGPAGLEGGSLLADPTNAPKAIAGEACTDQADVQKGGVSSTVTGDKDKYWQLRDFHAELRADWNKTRASVFYVHGLQDWNVEPHMMQDWLPAIQATGVPYKIWLGQWNHNWPDGTLGHCKRPKSACRDDFWNTTMVAWFDQFLKDKQTGILDAPPVQVQGDDGVWRHDVHFPPTDVQWMTLHPTGDRKLASSPGTGSASFYDYQGMQPLVPNHGADRVEFVGAPLEKDVRITGLPCFVGNVTAGGQRASLILTLVVRNATGDRPVDFAGQSLNHVASLAKGASDIHGKKQKVSVDFYPQDLLVPAGSRLVLVASGWDIVGRARLQPISDGGDTQLDLDGARLELPIKSASVTESPQPYWK
jgi:X-Pro dipeptidyl-peptidase